MSAQMTAPFSGVYGEETQKTPPRLEAPERDSDFQTKMSKLIGSLQNSDLTSRDSIATSVRKWTASMRWGRSPGRQMKDDNERVIQHQGTVMAGATAAVAAARIRRQRAK